VEEARRVGVERIEIIHPAHIHSKHTIEQMKAQAARGARLMLSGLGALAFPLHESGPLYAARIVKEVGPSNLVYGSDFGQLQNIPHAVANRWMVKLLLAYGCTIAELRTLFQDSPADLLGMPRLTDADRPPPRRNEGSNHPQGWPDARRRAHGLQPALSRTVPAPEPAQRSSEESS
jgi:hypothetical protein